MISSSIEEKSNLLPRKIKVSVVMPVYNTNPEFLRVAIESVLNQTFKNFEFLILNDGDATGEVGKTVMSFNDERIKYFVNEKNLGISGSRNRLVELANGEYLAVVDHDDVSLPSRFEKEVEYLDKHSDIGVVSSWVKILGKSKVICDRTEDREIKEDLMLKYSVFHPASMLRKSVLIDNNIKYEKEFFPSEDYALWCRLISKTKFHVIPEVLFEYREHTNRTSLKFRNKLRHMSYAIHEFAHRENPDIWFNVKDRITKCTYIKLFRCVPFLKIMHAGNRTSVYLFNFIPLIYWNNQYTYDK